ncbi:MAG: RluA family pseudouridine synthase [Parachlamydiaceae bacterium]|nr:RluA family pseudouridine synthase [Parachlamydiaceae bacterium]
MKHIATADLTILDALTQFYPQSSKTTLRSWIKEGRVCVDGLYLKNTNLTVYKGQEILIGQKKKYIADRIPILYEDAEFVVIDKPTGLLSVSTDFEKNDTAHALLKDFYKPRKIYVVHRLDQDTSGVMLFAFGEQSGERLKKIFAAHDIDRSYTAIVEGTMASKSGTWKNYLYEDEGYVVHITDDPEKGEEAITHYKILASNKRYTWIAVTLETGKKNQIRVHCQAAGHPIVGDKKYGSKHNPIKRLALHANSLAFEHPSSHKKMYFESSIPQEFQKLVKPISRNQ